MRRLKKLLFTAGVAVLMATAIPSLATAAGWDLDIETGMFPLKFTVESSETTITRTGGGGTVTCLKTEGEGSYTTATEGTLDFTLKNCTKLGGEECHSKGAKAEEVTTTTVAFQNIMIDSTVQLLNGRPGILVTGNNNHVATLECKFGNVELIGNGFIGEISLLCSSGEWKSTPTVDFSSTAFGEQTYKQIETTGTVFDLTYRLGTSSGTASIDSKPKFKFERSVKTTCP